MNRRANMQPQRKLMSSKSFEGEDLLRTDVYAAPERKRSIDDLDVVNLSCPGTKPTLTKRSGWNRLKKIITDNKGLLGKISDSDEKRANRKSMEVDIELLKKTGDVTLRHLRKPNPILRRSPRLYSSNKYSLENLLQLAILENNEGATTKLLGNSKVDINFLHEPGSTVLHQACVIGNLNIIKLLIHNRADVKIRTWSGLSSLQVATFFGHFDVAQYLIQQGASCKDIQDGFTHDEKLMSTIFCLY